MLHRFRMAIAVLAIVPSAFAASTPQIADPSSPSAPTASFHYRSVLNDYQPAVDDESPDKIWRAANDKVGRIGGHAGYMKSGNHAAPAAHEGAESLPSRSAADGHGGHHGMHH